MCIYEVTEIHISAVLFCSVSFVGLSVILCPAWAFGLASPTSQSSEFFETHKPSVTC